MPIMPTPNGNMPMMGTIQCTCLSADQPYQKKLMGRMQAKIIMAGRRNSGWYLLLLRAVRAMTTLSLVMATAARPVMKPIPMPR